MLLLLMIWIVFAVVVMLFAFIWFMPQALRAGSTCRRHLESEGLVEIHLERRWWTRGPFRGVRRSDRIYRVTALDGSLNPKSGWMHWRPRWPWQPRPLVEPVWLEPELAGAGAPRIREGLRTAAALPILFLLMVSVLVLVVLSWRTVAAAPLDDGSPALVPLCPGLEIVTAVSQANGDYESIKTVLEANEQQIRLQYASEGLFFDPFSFDPPEMRKTEVVRLMGRADLEGAGLYLQLFDPQLPEQIPETTAVGTSRRVLESLIREGRAEMGFFLPGWGEGIPVERDQHPNIYDYAVVSTLERVGDGPVPFPVLVNGQIVELPAIVARADFFGDAAEFRFLADPQNPMTLAFRYGIDQIQPLDESMAKIFEEATGTKPKNEPGDRDALQVVKISWHCGEIASAAADGSGRGVPGLPAGDGAGNAGSATPADVGRLEEALADAGRAQVHTIHFSFDSAEIRPQSETTLAEIAAVMERHPEWTLRVEGHTDSIAEDDYNLDLSRRRAAAVVRALVERRGVAPARLESIGLGESAPVDTNETLAGRAHNRRVELVRGAVVGGGG